MGNAAMINVNMLDTGQVIMLDEVPHQVLGVSLEGKERFGADGLVHRHGLFYTLELRAQDGTKKTQQYAAEASFVSVCIDFFKPKEPEERAHAKMANFTDPAATSPFSQSFKDLMARRRALNALAHQLSLDILGFSNNRWHSQECALAGRGTNMQFSVTETEPCWCGIDADFERKLMQSLPDQRKPIKVKLTYFKPSGKYYSEGTYDSKKTTFWAIVDEVHDMLACGNNPGLQHDCVVRDQFSTAIDIQSDLLAVPHVITYQALCERKLGGQPIAKVGDQVELFAPAGHGSAPSPNGNTGLRE